MKKISLLLIMLSCLVSSAVAQRSFEFDLKPDERVSQEIILEGANPQEEIKLMLKVEWKQFDNQLKITFDRRTVSENDAYLLFFPLLSGSRLMKDVVDCKLEMKSFWSKNLNVGTTTVNHFMQSDNLVIDDPANCYISLANNNEEEFSFTIKEEEVDYSIELTNLFVGITQKRPWYSFSKKNKKVLFKIVPTTIVIRPEKTPEEPDRCALATVVVPYIEAQLAEQQISIAALMDAQQKKNCTVFNLLKDKIRRTFVEVNDRCERYTSECDEIAEAIKNYNDVCQSAMNEECVAAPQPAASCSLSESEISSVNTMLRNLQMKINIKKRDGQSLTEENREYQSIKASITPKLSAECRRTYKNLIDAYTNYCTVIEGLLR